MNNENLHPIFQGILSQFTGAVNNEQPMEAAPPNSKITESIYDNGSVIVPLAEVQHIERQKTTTREPNGLLLITKQTNYNFEKDMWDNPIYISEDKAQEFISIWCRYRAEKEKLDA